MAARSFILAAAFSALFILPARELVAQDQPQPEVENSRFQFLAAVNANAVQVRSGPGENYYATQRLEKGAQVQVVGHKFDWLKVVPPEGSFSVVAKAYVEKVNETTGKVSAEVLNVRAGSNLFNHESDGPVQTEEGPGRHDPRRAG